MPCFETLRIGGCEIQALFPRKFRFVSLALEASSDFLILLRSSNSRLRNSKYSYGHGTLYVLHGCRAFSSDRPAAYTRSFFGKDFGELEANTGIRSCNGGHLALLGFDSDSSEPGLGGETCDH